MKLYKYAGLFIFLAIICLIPVSGCAVMAEKPAPEILQEPVINSFTISPQTITAGEPVVLKWNVAEAVSVNIQPEIGPVSLYGSLTVWPKANTTYTLTAENEAGVNSGVARVNIIEEDTSSGCVIIGCDPVSGRNQGILLNLEQLCVATEYQVQIAKNPQFSLLVFDSGPYAPYSKTSPSFIYPAGGIFECGHTYYVRYRVRNTATGQAVISPWSPIECYIISPGFPTTNPN